MASVIGFSGGKADFICRWPHCEVRRVETQAAAEICGSHSLRAAGFFRITSESVIQILALWAAKRQEVLASWSLL